MRTKRGLAWAATLFLATSCGESGDSSERKSGDPESRAIPSANLARTGYIADAPQDATTVGIASDGTLHLGGKEGGLEEVEASLLALARDPRLREPDGSSKIDLILRIDKRAPWALVQWVMQIAAGPAIKMYRVNFAVAPETGGADGVIEAFLPKPSSPGPPHPFDERPPIRANLYAHEGIPDRGALFAAIRSLVDAGAQTVELGTPMPRIPRAGHVLTVLDLALRAGVTDVQFVGMRSPLRAGEQAASSPLGGDAASPSRPGSLPWLRAWVAQWSKENPDGYEVRIGTEMFRETPGGSGGPLPGPPARRAARTPTSATVEEEVPLEELPPTPEEIEEVHESTVIAKAPGGDAFPTRGGSGEAREVLPPTVSAAVDAALKWLAAHQSPDGGWEAEGFGLWCDGYPAKQEAEGAGRPAYDVGVTGLALLAFLGAGYTNRSEGPFGKVVGDGLRYLKNVQDAEGCFGPRERLHYIYNHALASLAMVEAYGMTGSPIYKSTTQKALDFIAAARNPKRAWRYGVRPGDDDTSVTGWMALVLSSARLINLADTAAGKSASLTLDDAAFAGAARFIDEMTDAKTGRVGYQVRGTGSARPEELVDLFPSDRTEAMTAIGVLVRTTLRENPATSRPIRLGVDLMRTLLPTWNPRGGWLDFYYWHAGSLAMFQVGGEAWTDWWAAIQAAVLPHQRTDGDPCGLKGSWDPLDPWGDSGGRVYATALLACTLETPTRYARRFPEPK